MREARAAIVVGVDGTESARAALSFAMREASRRGGALGVVTAWTERPARAAGDIVAGRESDRAHAQVVQDTAVADVLRGLGASPTLSRQVLEGDAATVLLRLAGTADYLVVGAGRPSPPASAASLGSVATHCVEAARCPVLVVHAPPEGNESLAGGPEPSSTPHTSTERS
jgi:nucleotide-binding universal stress UspA family protein